MIQKEPSQPLSLLYLLFKTKKGERWIVVVLLLCFMAFFLVRVRRL
jgi:hypothetical protein